MWVISLPSMTVKVRLMHVKFRVRHVVNTSMGPIFTSLCTWNAPSGQPEWALMRDRVSFSRLACSSGFPKPNLLGRSLSWFLGVQWLLTMDCVRSVHFEVDSSFPFFFSVSFPIYFSLLQVPPTVHPSWIFWRTSVLFSIVATPIYFPPIVYEGSLFSTSLANIYYLVPFWR